MRNISTLAAAALIAALTQGCHTQPPLSSASQTGKVEGVYVEAYNGVFVERQLATETDGKALCAYVTFPHRLPDGQTFVTAQLPAGLDVEAGDLVQVRFADPGAFETDAVPERNQVTALVAKGITQLARNFGAPTHASVQ
jgi:hypothetical protein